MIKWIGLVLVFVGILLVTRSVSLDYRSHFEDGSFIKEILLFVGGLISIAIGLILISGFLLFGF